MGPLGGILVGPRIQNLKENVPRGPKRADRNKSTFQDAEPQRAPQFKRDNKGLPRFDGAAGGGFPGPGGPG